MIRTGIRRYVRNIFRLANPDSPCMTLLFSHADCYVGETRDSKPHASREEEEKENGSMYVQKSTTQFLCEPRLLFVNPHVPSYPYKRKAIFPGPSDIPQDSGRPRLDIPVRSPMERESRCMIAPDRSILTNMHCGNRGWHPFV